MMDLWNKLFIGNVNQLLVAFSDDVQMYIPLKRIADRVIRLGQSEVSQSQGVSRG